MVEAERTAKKLREELESTKDELEKLKEDATMIAHIKGTLIQFLKNLPLTE